MELHKLDVLLIVKGVLIWEERFILLINSMQGRGTKHSGTILHPMDMNLRMFELGITLEVIQSTSLHIVGECYSIPYLQLSYLCLKISGDGEPSTV